MRAAKATVVAVRLELLNIPRVRRYHSARVQVWAWTAQTTPDLQMARAMRAEGVVAERPGDWRGRSTASALRAAVAAWRRRSG